MSGTVYARVVRYTVDPDRCDDAVDRFQEAGREIAQLDGFHSGLLLVDSNEGSMLSITLWENQNALDASEVRATSLRQTAARDVEGNVESVTRFNVAVGLGTEL